MTTGTRPLPRPPHAGRPATLLLLIAALGPSAALAAAGAPDPGFAVGGEKVIPFDRGGDFTDVAWDMALQADGKAVVVGSVDRSTTDVDFGVVRFDEAGDLDPLFGDGGKSLVPFDLGQDLQDEARALAVQPDGKIVIGGFAQMSGAGDRDFAFARLLADGTLDATFGTGGKTTVPIDLVLNGTDYLLDLTLQPDAKIVAVGAALADAMGNFDFAVVRLLSDGSLDTSFDGDGRTTIAFDAGGGVYDEADAVAVLPDGRILVAGIALGTSAQMAVVARLHANGTLDTTFDGDGKLVLNGLAGARDVAVLTDGRALLCGAQVGGGVRFGVARLTAAGTLDPTFDGDGLATIAFPTGPALAEALAVQADGKIVVAGQVGNGASGNDFGVARLLASGALDVGFGAAGRTLVAFDHGQANDDVARALGLRPDGRALVTGSVQRAAAGDTDFGVVQLLADDPPLFTDGFESGDLSAWSSTSP